MSIEWQLHSLVVHLITHDILTAYNSHSAKKQRFIKHFSHFLHKTEECTFRFLWHNVRGRPKPDIGQKFVHVFLELCVMFFLKTLCNVFLSLGVKPDIVPSVQILFQKSCRPNSFSEILKYCSINRFFTMYTSHNHN